MIGAIPPYDFMAWCLVKHRDFIPFTLHKHHCIKTANYWLQVSRYIQESFFFYRIKDSGQNKSIWKRFILFLTRKELCSIKPYLNPWFCSRMCEFRMLNQCNVDTV
jgi:hypothetical protein